MILFIALVFPLLIQIIRLLLKKEPIIRRSTIPPRYIIIDYIVVQN